MTAPTDPNRFEEMYLDERTAHGLPAATPWDIGGPRNPSFNNSSHSAVIKVRCSILVPDRATMHPLRVQRACRPPALTLRRGELERAKQNAKKAGVSVTSRCGCDQARGAGEQVSTLSSTAPSTTCSAPNRRLPEVLRQGPASGPPIRARGCTCFEFGLRTASTASRCQRSLVEDDFRQVFPAAGWEITYLGPTTYQGNMSAEVVVRGDGHARPRDGRRDEPACWSGCGVIEPWLVDGRVHMPFWEIARHPASARPPWHRPQRDRVDA